jgi:hypothetical protein
VIIDVVVVVLAVVVVVVGVSTIIRVDWVDDDGENDDLGGDCFNNDDLVGL